MNTPNPTLLALEDVLVKTYPGGKSHVQFAGIIVRALAARGFKITPINEAPTAPTPTYECMACGTTWTADIDVCPTCQDPTAESSTAIHMEGKGL